MEVWDMNVAKKYFPMGLILVGFCLSTGAATTLEGGEQQKEFVFSSIDPPGSVYTVPQGINEPGDISGGFIDARGAHGFLLRDGKMTAIDYPGAAWTWARGINAQGDIVGDYGRPDEPLPPIPPNALAQHGFRLSRMGQFVPLHYPGHLYEIPQGITSTGIVLGCYHDHDFMASMHGFTRSREGFVAFSVPSSMHNGATPDGSRIAGLYNDLETGLRHGYLLDHGRFVPFDVPDSTLTEAWDINPEGDVVGVYRDRSGQFHGFLRDEHGRFTSFDFPGSTNTGARGINAQGDIVGWYDDSAGTRRGFVARPRQDDDSAE
jgi:uncharacterized membrane protein